jgi:hypothetical protein
LVKTANVFLAVLFPLTLKVGAAAPEGQVTAQVYVKLDSPPTSAPKTDKVAIVPLDQIRAAAAVFAVGGGFPEFTTCVIGGEVLPV